MPVATSQPATLTRQDRCDRCGAQAFVRATLPGDGLSLLFCGHHFRAHELAPMWDFDDEDAMREHLPRLAALAYDAD